MSARILVVGAGAIGGVTAAHLTRAGHDVVVLDADREHVSLMRDPGLRLDYLGTEQLVRLRAVSSPIDLDGTFDFALITLKSTHLRAALEPLVAGGMVSTYVSLGNGLVHDTIGGLVGPERLITGVVEWGATNLGPGHLRQTTRAPFIVGESDGTASQRLAELTAVLNDAAETRQTGDVFGHVWSKLLINSTFSGLGTVGRCVYGDLASDATRRALVYAVWSEGHAVATALGARLQPVFDLDPARFAVHRNGDVTQADAALATLMATASPTRASMLQDVERGRPTEVDVINGGVVATATRLGMTAPLNDAIATVIAGAMGEPEHLGPHQIAHIASLI